MFPPSMAVDAESGKQVWEVQTLPPNLPYSVTMAPRIVKGKVIIGNSGGEYAVRGFVSAYDAETGKLAWRFYTVPGDPAKPFEHPDLAAAAKTWTGEWWKMGGGGTVWDALSYDPDADLLYIGTGNGGPWNRDARSPGGGDNWYLSSIVAVKPDNGRYVWHYQTTPGDNWDYTAGAGAFFGVAPPPPPGANPAPAPPPAANAPAGGTAPPPNPANMPRVFTFVLDGKASLPNAPK